METIQKKETIEELNSDFKNKEIEIKNKKLESTESDNDILNYIKSKWIELIGLLIAVLAFVIPIYKYLSQKREEQKDKRFQTYHQLIADLANPPGGKLDRQIATVFELRNFPNYFELTKRIMTDLTTQWENDPDNKRLITELNLTLSYIEKKSKWFNRWAYKIFRVK